MKPLSVGDPLRLGPYRLHGVLGEGGMGKVYVGQDEAGTVSAVKVLHPELAHEENLARRFIREATAAQAVTSRGVARVLGAQTEGGRPWIATEFLAGPTLDQAVGRHGPFGEAALRALAASLASTLADVHAAGLIHRDLKPPNIVLTSAGPRVIDFGIARPEHGLTLTTTGQIPVTPGYGAPEQVLGQRVAPPADVFSLGAVLVYAATGNRAFDGGHVAALQYAVVHGEPQLDGVPGQLRSLVEPCLAKDPAARPLPAQIAAAFAPPRGSERVWKRGELAADIKERERNVQRLTTTTVVPGARTPVSRRRMLAGLAAGGVVVAGGGGAAAWWLLSRREESALFAFPPAAKTPEAGVLSADDGDYVTGETSKKTLWKRDRVVAVDSPAPLPVRDVVVFGGLDGGLEALNVVDGKRRWSVPDLNVKGRYLSLSDRLVVALDDEGTLRTYVPSTGEPKWTAAAAADVLLAADDEAVYLVTEDGELRSVRRSDAGIRWTVRVPAAFRGRLRPPGVAGRGRLVVSTDEGDVLAFDSADGRKSWDLRGRADGSIRPALEGGTVYLGGDSLTARAVRDGEEKWTVEETDPVDGKREVWGPPLAFPDLVYATHGITLRCLEPGDGSEVWDARPLGKPAGPVAAQGRNLWTLDDETFNQVTVIDKTDGELDRYHALAEAERRWLVGDGNRVFVMNDTALHALPVS